MAEAAAAPAPAPAWALVEELASRDRARRMRAVTQLRSLGQAAAPALERGLACDSRVEIRRWCAHLLQQGRHRGSASAIVAATHDPIATVRLLALHALAGDPGPDDDLGLDPVPHLVRLVRQDRSKRVRQAALQHLRQRLDDPRARAAVAEASASGAARVIPPRRGALWLPREVGDARPVAAQH